MTKQNLNLNGKSRGTQICNNRRKISILMLVILVILASFCLGYFFGKRNQNSGLDKSSNQTTDVSSKSGSYQDGWNAAKKRLQETGFVMIDKNMEIKNITGTVQEVKNDKINLKINPFEPLSDPDLDARFISIRDDTKIYIQERKDPNVYQEEMNEYNKKMEQAIAAGPEGAASLPTMPEAFIKKEAKLSDIKTDQTINVTADENIRNSKNFFAKEIMIQENIPTALPEVPPVENAGNSSPDESIPPTAD